MRGWTQESASDRGASGLASRTARWARRLLRWGSRNPLAALGAALVLAVALGVVLAPLLTPYDPTDINPDALLQPPGRQHLLGTDNLGRDVFARLAHGGRISLYVGLASVALGSVIGAGLGLVSGYRGGATDSATRLLLDTLLAFPSLVLALTVIAALGSSLNNIIIAIGATQVPWVARVVRGTALSVRESQYVEAARVTGCGDWRIMAVHILPQCLAPLLVVATAALGSAIIAEASLSFLGLGVPPPEPSWGGMLSGTARDYALVAPWMVVPPGAAISLTVYGVNLLGDGLRDALDPRLRGE